MIGSTQLRWMVGGAVVGAGVLGLAFNLSPKLASAQIPLKEDTQVQPPAQDVLKAGGETQPLNVKDISTAQALAAMQAAEAKAAQMNLKMDIAVVDAGGNLKAFERMDGAWLGSIDIAMKKAKTARDFDMPTGDVGKLSQPGGPLYQIEVSNGGLITFPGGLPIKSADGTIIGAIGVSGSTVDNDNTVATAGAAVK